MSIGMHEYKPGNEWGICDYCGFKFRGSELRMNWKHQKVCIENCWEPRHPQISIKAVREKIVVKNSRPEPTPSYLEYGEVSSSDL